VLLATTRTDRNQRLQAIAGFALAGPEQPKCSIRRRYALPPLKMGCCLDRASKAPPVTLPVGYVLEMGDRADAVDSLADLDGVTPVALDLSDPAAPAALVQRAVDDHGTIDVLVNNVGAVRLRLDGFLAVSDDDFEWSMQMNFFTTLRATRAAVPVMVDRGSGAIVNVASVNAFYQPDGATIDYGASKAAVANLTKALAQELGPKGIHVNAVSPGPVSTDLWLGDHGVAATVAAATGVDVATARERIVAGMGGFATGRFSTAEEVATLVVLLASERTANVTGANYVIDGGLIKTT
jgi:NAD(P)-dependent dehydrogenase (short-subunit alcohol dehydrogenase family)